MERVSYITPTPLFTMMANFLRENFKESDKFFIQMVTHTLEIGIKDMKQDKGIYFIKMVTSIG